MCFLFPGICMKPLQTNYIQDEETNEKKKFIKVLFYHHCCLTVDWTQCLTVLRNLCCSEKNVRHIFIMRSYRLLNYAVYGIKNIKSSSSKSWECRINFFLKNPASVDTPERANSNPDNWRLQADLYFCICKCVNTCRRQCADIHICQKICSRCECVH